ncbi:uncharacterized protein LOC132049751 isoform X2 [Lycium ferocissimum]|uniref:uncharacterized protein LOC132049751 isoform X2 n=1 Tax=Lycium ferocissimum TaxID=112874 RepID=UPI002814A07F|nr:uncharacterized protein LOC132049751 isoform X2 [Lycium ferocissimum]
MENKLDDYEFWLPSQFLTDDDLLIDFKRNKYLGPGFNPFGPHSDLSSPVESVIGSVDTESDEEEWLTHKMANSTLHQDSGFGYGNTKGWSLSGSPQSTLCGCKQGSGHGSPNCPSHASSPPPVNGSSGAFDQLYAADGLYQTKTSRGSVATQNSKPSLASLNLNQPSLSYQQLQVAQFQRLKQQQMLKQGQAVFGSGKGGFEQYPVNQNHQQLVHSRGQSGAARQMNSSVSGWSKLQQSQSQQQPGLGMRAIFLGNPGPKRECAGTGVFLPRRIGTTQTETRKKPGCSTVLLPDRVVQALNLNLEAMENLNLEAMDARSQPRVQARFYNGESGLTLASGSKYPNNMAVAQQRRNVRTENTYSQPASMSQEFVLPQDWTY